MKRTEVLWRKHIIRSLATIPFFEGLLPSAVRQFTATWPQYEIFRFLNFIERLTNNN